MGFVFNSSTSKEKTGSGIVTVANKKRPSPPVDSSDVSHPKLLTRKSVRILRSFGFIVPQNAYRR